MSHATQKGRHARSGFSVIEVMVTMVLVAIAMLNLAPVMMKVSRLSTQATTQTQASAALGGEVQRLEAQAFDSLAVGSSCTTFSSSGFPHTKCVTVTAVNSKTKLVMVIITPLSGNARPDTTVIQRSKGAGTNPLKLP